MDKVTLNGVSWDHSRGTTPLLAAAQRYGELHPHVEIVWHKRNLQQFADQSIESLTDRYDLMIIDHPWCGRAASSGCVIPLDEWLSAEYLDDQAKNSVGASHKSYLFQGHQWCLAIDASTPVTSYRADLFKTNNKALPENWNELLSFADTGRLLVAGIPVDTLMSFYMFCIAHGHEPFQTDTHVIDVDTGRKALESMSELWSKCNEIIFKLNPIGVAEIMSSSDDFWYCPFAYAYSNYCRRGFAKHSLTYTDLPFFGSRGRLISTIGGAGIAVSTKCRNKDIAVQFLEWICSGEKQSTLYVQHGGQPGHKEAWMDEQTNVLCNNFFKNILPAMERGYVRPRYNGYLHFQDNAANVLWSYLYEGGDGDKTLYAMNNIYQESLKSVT